MKRDLPLQGSPYPLVVTPSLPRIIPASRFFDGSDGRIAWVNGKPEIDVDRITLATWLQPHTVTGTKQFLSTATALGVGTGRVAFQQLGSTIRFIVLFSGANGVWSSDHTVVSGEWIHVVVTYDGSSVANDPIIYINGVDAGLTEAAAPTGTRTTGGDSLVVGSSPNASTTSVFNGLMCDVAAWATVLSPQDVADLRRGVPPKIIRARSLVLHTLTGAPIERDQATGMAPDSQGGAFPLAPGPPATRWLKTVRPFAVVGGGVTGSGSLVAGAAVLAGTGVSESVGVGAPAAAAAVMAGAGVSESIGSGALAAAAAAAAGAGVSASVGSGALVSSGSSAAGVGDSKSAGTGALAATAAAAAGAGVSESVGGGALQAAAASMAGVGTVGGVSTGTGALAAGGAAAVGTGVSLSVGSGALAAAPAATAGAGISSSVGAGTLTASPSSTSGTGVLSSVGGGALQAAAASTSGSGVSKSVGTGTITAGAATAEGTDGVPMALTATISTSAALAGDHAIAVQLAGVLKTELILAGIQELRPENDE